MQCNQIFQGEALAVLKTMPDNFVQCVVTSPPYYGLRSYLPDGHPDKPLEIGLEETPGEYIEKLVQVFREVKRVLRNDGTCWLNLGDSYAGSGKGSGGKDHGKLGPHANDFLPTSKCTELPSKNLLMIPARVAIALQDDGWILRSDVIWAKSNAMPESVTDRPTSSHEHIFLLAKSERYFYDADAIRECAVKGSSGAGARNYLAIADGAKRYRLGQTEQGKEQGRNKRNVWTIASQPYAEAHFATFPPKLAETCILAGSRPGDIVMDCFCGAGTVPLVALQNNRQYIGIELSPEYVKLIEKRIATIQPVLWSLAEEVSA